MEGSPRVHPDKLQCWSSDTRGAGHQPLMSQERRWVTPIRHNEDPQALRDMLSVASRNTRTFKNAFSVPSC